MNSESPNNIRLSCPKHAPRPHPKYQSWNPQKFMGTHVKRAFLSKKSEKEHLWVKVNAIKNEKTLIGTLANDPILDIGYKYNDPVEVDIICIEKVYDGERVL